MIQRPLGADEDRGRPVAQGVVDDEGGESMRIEVRDHGPGFDPGFLPRAFDRFARADDARTGRGVGLGLAIAAALSRRNSGHITAANQSGGGAVLSLTLPLAHPPISVSP
jgi:signal transduction histidine kinase